MSTLAWEFKGERMAKIKEQNSNRNLFFMRGNVDRVCAAGEQHLKLLKIRDDDDHWAWRR